MKEFLVVSFLVFAVHSMSANAGIKEQMDKMLDFKSFSNSTSPQIIEGQSAQYLTGGSYVQRQEVMGPFNFVDVQTPRLSAGCGGIDLYMGGISAVNSDKFIKMLRAIGQNTTSLAFMLALKTVSPMIENVMNQVSYYANMINKMNMDSCEAASMITKGALSAMQVKDANCIVNKIEKNGMGWRQAQEECGNNGASASLSNDESNKIGYTRGNLAWMVLMKDDFFKNDQKFAEVVMNLTGTIIIPQEDGKEPFRLPSAVKGGEKGGLYEKIFDYMLNGSGKGTVKIFKCRDATNDPLSCQSFVDTPSDLDITVTGVKDKVDTLVEGIIKNIYADIPLEPEQEGLVKSTSLPLLTLLTTIAAGSPKQTVSTSMGLVYRYTSLVARDILTRMLGEVVEKVDIMSVNVKGVSSSDEMKKFREDLAAILKVIYKERSAIAEQSDSMIDMMTTINFYEKIIVSRLNQKFITNMNWSE